MRVAERIEADVATPDATALGLLAASSYESYLPPRNLGLAGSGSTNRPKSASSLEVPTGCTRPPINSLVPLCIPLTFVLLSGAGSAGESPARITRDLGRSTTVAASLLTTRRSRDEEGEAPVDLGVPASTETTDLSREAIGASAESTTEGGAVAITADDQVTGIQDALSLSVTQLKDILNVSRATIYGWLRGDVSLPRDTATTLRLRELHRVATMWRTLSSEHLGRLVAAPLGDTAPSLFALLKAPTWDMHAIGSTMRALATRLEDRNTENRLARSNGLSAARTVTAENIELERLRLRGLE